MQHTPGPWLTTDELVYALDETGSINRFTALVQRGKVTYRGDPTSKDELHANARLIAAAPDMHAALIAAKTMLWLTARAEWTLAHFKNWAVIQQIDAALEKADGIPRSAKATNDPVGETA